MVYVAALLVIAGMAVWGITDRFLTGFELATGRRAAGALLIVASLLCTHLGYYTAGVAVALLAVLAAYTSPEETP